MTRTAPIAYKGASIEQERDGSFSIFFAGNPHATKGGLRSQDEAKAYLDKWA